MINKIASHLKNGGQVYHLEYDMYVLAYFDNLLMQYVILGDIDTKFLYLQVNIDQLNEDDFVFIDKEEK